MTWDVTSNVNGKNAKRIMCTQLRFYWMGVSDLGEVRGDLVMNTLLRYSHARQAAVQAREDVSEYPCEFPPNYSGLISMCNLPGLSEAEKERRLRLLMETIRMDREKYSELGRRLEEALNQ